MRAAGGLCVIGTERHESRRIDNQLRGRAGRQGDPGDTQFYLSLEDDLMRLFGGYRMDSIGRMMEKTDMPDDMPIQASMVSKAIESAQRQVEASNFAARKHVLEYDDVMNLQRKAIYAERNAILDGKDLTDRMPEIIDDIVESHVLEWCPAKQASDDWDLDCLNKWVIQMTGIEDFTVDSIDHDDDVNALIDGLVEFFQGLFDAKAKEIGAPFADIESQVMLRFIDTRWMAHLQEMDYLKACIGLRAYGQRDPLVEYKTEAYGAFRARRHHVRGLPAHCSCASRSRLPRRLWNTRRSPPLGCALLWSRRGRRRQQRRYAHAGSGAGPRRRPGWSGRTPAPAARRPPTASPRAPTRTPAWAATTRAPAERQEVQELPRQE